MHFYTQTPNGIEPRHTVPMTKDPSRTRASRAKDAEKAFKESGEVWNPSVTTILGILKKPALITWEIDQHLEQAFSISPEGFDLAEWKKIVKQTATEQMNLAPKAGTDIHQVLEDFMTDKKHPEAGTIELEICQNVERVLYEQCGIKDWQCEEYFICNEYGYAGCADLLCDEWVIDYKSKRFADKFKPQKMVFPEYLQQLAAYIHGFGLSIKETKSANIFVCLETGEVDFHLHKTQDLEKGLLDFLDCADIFHRNTFDPYYLGR